VEITSGVYKPRDPRTTALYEVVRDNLETLYGAIGDGAIAVRIPKHARKELENLIERVLPPQSGLRQWVLTFPFPRRRRLAQDGALLGKLTRIFVETVHAFYAERAARDGALGAKTGAVTAVQRTSSDLRLDLRPEP
jgi:hypothetical protein